jgi:hypothetical protein
LDAYGVARGLWRSEGLDTRGNRKELAAAGEDRQTTYPAGIGFLVAAKSILRFEEAKEQKLAEYVLIKSLLSFSIAIALSAATRWTMGL